MNAIQTYIENLFKPLPDSREVRRARTELLQMCEDRYTELRNSGASDNEAVGQVITQFGNLDELADDLGIRTEVDTYRDSGVHLSKAEAETFLAQRRRKARFVAAGVFLCLIGFGIIATLSMAEDAPKGALFTNTGPLSPSRPAWLGYSFSLRSVCHCSSSRVPQAPTSMSMSSIRSTSNLTFCSPTKRRRIYG